MHSTFFIVLKIQNCFSDYSRFLGPNGEPDESFLDDVQDELKLAAVFTGVKIHTVKRTLLKNGSTKVEVEQELSRLQNGFKFTVSFHTKDRVRL